MILLVTLIVTGKDIFSEDDAKVIVKKTINLCKPDNNRFTFAVNIGEVKTTDSLFGFNIEISYDPSKIRIINVLTGNTLSENFKENSFSFGYEENKVKGYATTMEVNIVPPSGNKDLIAFFAEWIGKNDCNDSSIVEINSLEFTDEFQKKIDKFEQGVVYTVNNPEKDELLLITSDKREYNIPSGITELKTYVTISKPETSKTSSFKVYFDNSDVLKIKQIKNLDEHSIIKNVGDNYFDFDFTYANTNTEIGITYDYILRDTVKNYSYGVTKVEYSDCSCIYNYAGFRFDLIKDSVFASVQDDLRIDYDCNSNSVRISDSRIQNIKFVDILGRDLGNYEITEPTTINLTNISTNMIFGIIKVNNNYEIKRFYKCY